MKDKEKIVVDYLQMHRHFFDNHLELLDSLKIAHHTKGTISLVEMKLEQQRQRIQQLEGELAKLSQIAEYNEQLFFSLISLQETLNKAKTLANGVKQLDNWAGLLGLRVYILLCDDRLALRKRSQNSSIKWVNKDILATIRKKYFGLQSIYLGELAVEQKPLFFNQSELEIGSVALCLMNHQQRYLTYSGLLAFVSDEPTHFQRWQDNTFLIRLVNMVEPYFSHWLKDV